jgi:hypothetical protein
MGLRPPPGTEDKPRTASYSFVHAAESAINYLLRLHNLRAKRICTGFVHRHINGCTYGPASLRSGPSYTVALEAGKQNRGEPKALVSGCHEPKHSARRLPAGRLS